jgi:hypothetical protein
MGQIENMTEKDAENLKAMIEALNEKKVLPESPMTFKTFPMEDLEFSKRLTVLEEKVDSILTKLTNIFGDSVLIKGRFQDLLVPKK